MHANTIRALLEIVQYAVTIRSAMRFWHHSMTLHHLADILLAHLRAPCSSTKCGTTTRSFLVCYFVSGMTLLSDLIVSSALVATIKACDLKLAFGSKYIPKYITLELDYVLSLKLVMCPLSCKKKLALFSSEPFLCLPLLTSLQPLP